MCFLADGHLDNSSNSLRSATTNANPSSIRLVTPTGKSSPPSTALQFQITDKSSSNPNGTFSTSKAFVLNSPSTTTKCSSSNASSPTPLLTLIPPGTTSPKIQTLNSVTIASSNDLNGTTPTDLSVKTSTMTNTNQSLFLAKNRVTLITNPVTANNGKTNSTSSSTTTNAITSKLVIQQNPNSNNSHSTFWPSQPTTQATKICKYSLSF